MVSSNDKSREEYRPLYLDKDSTEEEYTGKDLENIVRDARQRHRTGSRLTLSLVVNVALTMALVVGLTYSITSLPRRRLATPVPVFDTEVRTFKLDPLFLSLPSPESDKAWHDLPGPNGRGFIHLKELNGEKYGYPDEKGGLSVFHQLHCLGMLRKFTWELIRGEHDIDALLKTWPENVTQPTVHQAIDGIWHVAHCFDYLRQAITCSADLSLEFVPKNTGGDIVNGLDYPHECKKWEDVWAFAEKYQ